MDCIEILSHGTPFTLALFSKVSSDWIVRYSVILAVIGVGEVLILFASGDE